MATVRIAHAEPRPGRLRDGGFQTRGYLVVLADDARHRAVPVWMRGEPGEEDLARLVELRGQPTGDLAGIAIPQELTTRLLGAAGARVTGVDIDVTERDADDLTPAGTVARVTITSASGARQVTACLGLGLAVAAATGAPVRVPDGVLDRLARPVPGDDLLTPFLDRVPPSARLLPGGGLPGSPVGVPPAKRPRFEPRNLDFADGLDRWDLDRPEDYAATTHAQSVTMSPAARESAATATLLQTIFADDYRGASVAFGGEIRTDPGTGQAGLRLEVLRRWRDREGHEVTVSGGAGWAWHEVTAPVPGDADLIRFGVTLSGAGRITLRGAKLARRG